MRLQRRGYIGLMINKDNLFIYYNKKRFMI